MKRINRTRQIRYPVHPVASLNAGHARLQSGQKSADALETIVVSGDTGDFLIALVADDDFRLILIRLEIDNDQRITGPGHFVYFDARRVGNQDCAVAVAVRSSTLVG